MALELPFGVQTVNPVAVDYWSGPYSGVLTQAAVDATNSGIPAGVRFVGMEASLVIDGVTAKYWYQSGVADSDLVLFAATSASGSFFTNFEADDGTVSATSVSDTIRLVNTSKTGAKEITVNGGGGGGNKSYLNVSSDISMTDADDVIFADSTSNPINVYIPTAGTAGGKEITVKRAAGDQPVVVIASGTEQIDGQGSRTLFHLYESITLISNNTYWFIT